MASIVQIPTETLLKDIRRVQVLTIACMSVEAALSLWAAWTARSPALAAFGGDSAVELMSAAIVCGAFVSLHRSTQSNVPRVSPAVCL